MYLKFEEWMDVICDDYLHDFVKHGGAAVKFVVPIEEIEESQVIDTLRQCSEREDYLFVKVNAISTKIHMIDKIFHEVARQIDWDELAHAFVKKIFLKNKYKLPMRREDFNLENIAAINKREGKFLRRELRSWLEDEIFHDFEMSQEFRIAMIRLCIDQVEPKSLSHFLSNAIKEWLRGELRMISTLKDAIIFQKIARHNARHMLFSLSHWLRINGKSGLVIMLDIRRYLIPIRSINPNDGFFYSIPALLDAYEVLRQFIDGTDEMEGMLFIVLASRAFLNDDIRGLNRYEALKLRIWDEVRDKRKQNPLASLVRLSTN